MWWTICSPQINYIYALMFRFLVILLGKTLVIMRRHVSINIFTRKSHTNNVSLRKNNSHHTYSCPRDCTVCGPNWGPLWNLSDYNNIILLSGLRDALIWVHIMPRDASFSFSGCDYFPVCTLFNLVHVKYSKYLRFERGIKIVRYIIHTRSK